MIDCFEAGAGIQGARSFFDFRGEQFMGVALASQHVVLEDDLTRLLIREWFQIPGPPISLLIAVGPALIAGAHRGSITSTPASDCLAIVPVLP